MPKGIKLDLKKNASLLSWTCAPAKIPSKIIRFVPKTAEILVKRSDKVKVGQRIAEIIQEDFRFPIYSSISGEVRDISLFPHPIEKSELGIEILSDSTEERSISWQEDSDWQSLNADGRLRRILEAGLTNFDWPERILYQELREIREKKTETLFVNAADAEPYVTCHQSLVTTHALEILKAAEMLREIVGAKKIILIVDAGQEETLELLKSKIYFLKWNHCEVHRLPPFYPPAFDKLVLEDSIFYPATLVFAVYEAVVKKKPLIERPVTVGGECVVEPRNRWIRIGSSFEEAIKSCRGLLREPFKIIMNGPMNGFAQEILQVPVLSATSAVLALPDRKSVV